MTKKYEYTISFSDDLYQLNKMGSQGWELVAVTHRNGYEARCYFKRELSTRIDPPL